MTEPIKEVLPESKWDWLRVAVSNLDTDTKIAMFWVGVIAVIFGMLLVALGHK
jgi:hypothetical protein